MKYIMTSFVLIILATAVTSLHRRGTEILASMAEEYSLCSETNICSDEEIFEMANMYVDEHVSWKKPNLFLNAFLLKWKLGLHSFSREMEGAPPVYPRSS